jgi:uncharacterized protein (TIRG00374 family)
VKTRIIFWGGIALGVALLLLMLRSYGGSALGLLREAASVPGVVLFLVAVTSTIGCLAWRWGFLLRGLTPSPPLSLLCLLRSAGHSLAVLIPSGKLGGDPLRAWLVTKAGVPGGDAVASVAADRILETISSAPFSILFGLLLLQHGIPQLDRALITILVGTLSLVVVVILVARALQRGRGIVSELVRRVAPERSTGLSTRLEVIEAAETATASLILQRRRLLSAFGAGLVANCLVVMEFVTLLGAFGLPHDLVAVVAAIFATGAAHTLPIPAGVGVLEGAQVWIFAMLGYPTEVGLAVGLAVRLREVLWMLPGLLYMLARTLRA